MFNRIFNSQTKTVTFAAILIGLSSAISRILGLIRNGLLAGYFGTKTEANIYLAAFRIPDLVYNVLIVGGLAVAFLPLFSEYFTKNKEKAWEMTNYVLNIFLFLLILTSLVLFFLAPQLMEIIVPGFSPQDRALTVVLARIMFLSPIFFGMSNIFSGILQYFNRFLVYSLAPILYNLGIIFGILFFYPTFGLLGLAYGVILGAFCHWLVQIPAAINSGFSYRFLFDFKYPAIKKIFYLMIPRTFTVAAQQINLLVITAIASTIAGGIAIFNYANDFQYFPIGIIAIPFAIAVFPTLSKAWASNDKEKFLEQFSLAFRHILFLIIPISLLMFILRAQIIRLVLGTLGPQEFDWPATKLTAACLGLFSIGIFALAFIHLISRAFFSMQDTKTPTLIAVGAVILNIILSFNFVRLLKFPNFIQDFLRAILKLEGMENISVTGLPLAFSLSVIFQFILLLFFFYKKIGDIKLIEIWRSLSKIIIASILMILFTYFTLYFSANFVNTKTVFGLSLQTVLAGAVGGFVYILITFLLKSPEFETFKYSILRQFQSKS
ncbi:murein biosynthesis integral membrane protein MurJ [Patescibacteria group bacterium]|nr:murein biosynthesis integral membrane protein MurJ [Patescibacteria group bacterium]